MLLCLGLSYRTAPLALRERLTASFESFAAVFARQDVFSELAILSTCNRLEVYVAAGAADFDSLAALVQEATHVPRADFTASLYHYVALEAVDHLCRVAAGLDSMILGEPQILGQVTRAQEAAKEFGTLGPALSALFTTSIRAGKRARTETGISRNPASVSSVAAKLAQQVIHDLGNASVLIIGAGEMAELTVEALRSRGAKRIAVISRTLARAEGLAARWGAEALTYDSLGLALTAADVVVTSTSAPHYIVTRERAQAAMFNRPSRPLVLIDIAVPRDVAPEVAEMPGIFCYNIDDLKARFEGAISEREQEVPRVEVIIAEEVQTFATGLRSAEVTPLIADLRAKADAIRRAEVAKTLRHLPHLDEADRQRIEHLTVALVNKLFHDPTLRLKDEANQGEAARYSAVLRHLFALNG